MRAQVLRACQESDIEVIIDCFMPDHVHKLVRGRTPSADARKFIKRAKQYSGYYFQREFKLRLWQRYGRDQVIWNSGDAPRVAQYIIENPVRAGLVKRPEDYPFTGSQIYSLEELLKWAYS